MSSCLMSVVLIVDSYRDRGERALQSVLAQPNINDLEVLLFDLTENATPLTGSDHPSVRCIAMPGAARTKTFGEVRAEAVRMAQSPFVAFLEEHSAALDGWAEATLKAMHDLGDQYAGVSGPPVNDFSQSGIIDAIRLMNDSAPLAAHTRRDVVQLVHNNTTYRRDVLLSYGDALTDLMAGETLMFARLLHDGYKLAADSDIQFIHVRELYLSGHGKGNYTSNRSISRNLAKLQQWSMARTLFTILAAPLLPFARTVKLFGYWRRKDSSKIGLLIRNLPMVIAMHYTVVMGQAMGLAFGEGKAGIEYLDYAVNVPRPAPDMDRVLKALHNG